MSDVASLFYVTSIVNLLKAGKINCEVSLHVVSNEHWTNNVNRILDLYIFVCCRLLQISTAVTYLKYTRVAESVCQ